VGDEVKAAFEAGDATAGACFKPAGAPGKWLANLPLLASRHLQALGVRQVHGNDGSPAWCTVANASKFFSYRRERVSGRFAALVWRER
jgi:polyphenol oxidase